MTSLYILEVKGKRPVPMTGTLDQAVEKAHVLSRELKRPVALYDGGGNRFRTIRSPNTDEPQAVYTVKPLRCAGGCRVDEEPAETVKGLTAASEAASQLAAEMEHHVAILNQDGVAVAYASWPPPLVMS